MQLSWHAPLRLKNLNNKTEPTENLCRSWLAAMGAVPIAARARRLRLFCALRPLDRLDDRRAVAFGRPARGVATGVIGLGDAGALREQGLHDFDVATARRDHQRRH